MDHKKVSVNAILNRLGVKKKELWRGHKKLTHIPPINPGGNLPLSTITISPFCRLCNP